VYETPLVQAKAINVEGRDAVAIELDVPLAGSSPAVHLPVECDRRRGGSFAFPRFAVLVREPAAAPPAAAAPARRSSSAGRARGRFFSGRLRCMPSAPTRKGSGGSRAAAGAALEVIGRGEDHVRPFEVIVFGFERRAACAAAGIWIAIHSSIFSRTRPLLLPKARPKAMGRIEA
jgi:hypothetical protein